MRRKTIMVILVLIVASFTLYGCSQSNPAKTGSLEISIEELAKYNGENGNPAYVAVDGIIYDVSKSAKWPAGKHCSFTPGKDLTDPIKKVSPHGTAVMTRVPAVGKIVEK